MLIEETCYSTEDTLDFDIVRCMKPLNHRPPFHFHVTEDGYRVSWTEK